MSSNVQSLNPTIRNGQVRAGSSSAADEQALEIRRVKCVLTESLFKRLLRKLFPDQRKQERIAVPPLVGYLGTMQATKPYDVGDISLSGFCLLTNERWTPGTEMPITLQRTNIVGEIESECFTVQATVVRAGVDGVAFSILLSESESNAAYGNPLQVRWTSIPEMELFLKRLKMEQESGVPVDGSATAADSAQGTQVEPRGSLKAAFDVGHQAAWTQTGSD